METFTVPNTNANVGRDIGDGSQSRDRGKTADYSNERWPNNYSLFIISGTSDEQDGFRMYQERAPQILWLPGGGDTTHVKFLSKTGGWR